MGNRKKSRQSSDFQKQKRKPGKKIQKTNVTNTTFKAKPLVLLKQLTDKDPESIVTSSGHTLPDILEKLNHFSEPIMAQGLDKLLLLLVKSPEVVYSSLNKVISSVGKIIGWDGISNDNLKSKLSKVLYRICLIPSNVMVPHFNHFATYVMTGLTNSKATMKIMALKCIMALCKEHRKSTQNSAEIFKSLMRFISCDCVKGKLPKNVLEVAFKALMQYVPIFINREKKDKNIGIISYEIHNDSFTVLDEPPPRIDPFEFKVIGFGNKAISPVTSIEGLCTLVDAVFVFFGRLLSLENFEMVNDLMHVRGIMNALYMILQNYIRKNVISKNVFGPLILELADKNKLMDGLMKKNDMNVIKILQKISDL